MGKAKGFADKQTDGQSDGPKTICLCIDRFGHKDCGKVKKYWKPTFSTFPIMFSTLSKTNPIM